MVDPIVADEPVQSSPSSDFGNICLILSGAMFATAIGYLLGVHILLAKIYTAAISHKTPSLILFGILAWIVGGGYLVSRYQSFRHFFVIASASAIALSIWWLFSYMRLDDGWTPIPFWLGTCLFASASMFSYCYNRHVHAGRFENLFELFALINIAALVIGVLTLFVVGTAEKARAQNTALMKFVQDFPDASTKGGHRYEIGRHKFECYYGNKYEGAMCIN